MKAFKRFVFLVTLFNLSLITLPVGSYAGWFSCLNPANWFRSSNKVMDVQPFNLIKEIKDIKTYQDKHTHDENETTSKEDFTFKLKGTSSFDVNAHTKKIVKFIESPSLQCNRLAYRIQKFFGVLNVLEAKRSGTTPLIAAVKVNSEDVVAALLAQGVRVNDQDSEGNTALTLAVKNGNLRIVQRLLKANADVTLKTPRKDVKDYDTALSIALQRYKRFNYFDMEYVGYHDLTDIVVALLRNVIDKNLQSKIKIAGLGLNQWIKENLTDAQQGALANALLNDGSGSGAFLSML